MIRRLEQDHLSADLAAVEDLLASAAPGDILGRMSLTERRDEVRKALADLDSKGETEGRTALFFGGAPVIGSRAVDADFAAEALGKYQDLVTKVWALKEHGSLAPSGPVPDRHEARLHVTNVVHGSFGFELAELQGPLTLQSSPLHEAIGVVTRALIAAGKGDDDLADVAEELDVRSFAALEEFFAVLQRAHASFRVVAGDTDYAFELSSCRARGRAHRRESHGGAGRTVSRRIPGGPPRGAPFRVPNHERHPSRPRCRRPRRGRPAQDERGASEPAVHGPCEGGHLDSPWTIAHAIRVAATGPGELIWWPALRGPHGGAWRGSRPDGLAARMVLSALSPRSMNTQDIVKKLWNLCNVLRDDGITYMQYVTELTYLLFLKMMKETGSQQGPGRGHPYCHGTHCRTG